MAPPSPPPAMAEEEEPLLPPQPPPQPPSAPWRNGAAFWLLGLCNNLPYVLMLSAARDLVEPQVPAPPRNGSRYDCNPISTGAVLLADILPTLLLKLLAPFAAPLLPYNLRVVLAALCAWGSFALVTAGAGPTASMGGVVLASAASGLGEVTLLALASAYPRVGLPCWASGSGAAGLGGALGYGGLLQGGLPLPHALLPALALPPLTLLSYFFLLGPPPRPPEPPPPPAVGLTLAEAWRVTKSVLPHAAPLTLVYFAEYFINQGLLELLYFPSSALTHNEQYRWYQLLYQAGVFVARSTPRCLRLRRLWALALLQVLNAVILLVAVAVPFLPGLAVAFALVAGEGLVGGAAYGNAFLNVAEEAPPGGREAAMTVAALGDTLGIALAGGVALGVHEGFCGAA